MKRSSSSILIGLLAITMLAVLPAWTVGLTPTRPARPHLPSRFFGIDPQSDIDGADAAYMAAGGIDSVRWPFLWGSIEPSAAGGFDWGPSDHLVAVAARHGLSVLPFVVGTPGWVAPDPRSLPVAGRAQRHAWASFLRAAARRYGPGGGFWRAHAPGTPDPLPRRPIRTWQIWNEPNFFYFASPISPLSYGRLFEVGARALTHVDPHARVILAGLFGLPQEPRSRGMPATRFLAAVYRTPGIRPLVGGISLHPYAAHVRTLETLAWRMRRVARRHGDGHAPLYITEMGWGSQPDPKVVGYERGPRGQARDLRAAYRFLIDDRTALGLAAVYWFSWRDLGGSCDFCDSAGLFRAGPGFDPKPAWRSFVRITGGKMRPGSG